MHLIHQIIPALCSVIVAAMTGVTASASGSKSVTMKVGETQTLNVPSSYLPQYLKSSAFYATSPDVVDVKSYTMTSVTVVAKKAFSSPVIVRCDYTYYILSGGRYVYGGRGFFDFSITVEDIRATSISLPATLQMEPGQRKKLTPTLTPSNATSAITWSSNPYSIVNVDKNGELLAQRKGTAVITATTSNGLSASCTVTVGNTDIPVEWVTMSEISYQIEPGDSHRLVASVYPSDATDKTLKWYSDNPSAVTVNSIGYITGVSDGFAKITATANNGQSAYCIVHCKSVLRLSESNGNTNLPSRANVIYIKSLLEGWNSFCVPFALEQSMLDKTESGCRIALVKSFSDKGVKVQVVAGVPAGQPCLIYVPESKSFRFEIDNAVLSPEPDNTGCLKGTYQMKTIGCGAYKLNSDGSSFAQTRGEDAICPPYRAYLVK